MDTTNEEVVTAKPLRSLLEVLEWAVKTGSAEEIESAANELLATVKLDEYTVKWRQEPYDGLEERTTIYPEKLFIVLDYEVVPESTGVWLYRTCGHCKNRELLGASHGSSRKTNRSEVLGMLKEVKEL